MNSLDQLASNTQIRVLPMRGGKEPVAFVYAVKVPDGYEETNYQFLSWAVDDFNKRAVRGAYAQ